MIHLSVKDQKGTTDWAVELGSPTVLAKYGWTQKQLKAGDLVSVDGWLASNGNKSVSAMSFKLSNGLELFAASAFFDLPFRASKGKTGICVSDEVCVDMAPIVSQR
jgi:hypothetical protein